MSITEHPNSPGQVVTRTAGTRAAGGVLTVIPAEELTK